MRLIDADALIFALETQDYSGSPESLEDWTPQDLTKAEIADINNAPTIDAVEVVRCKDCKYYESKCAYPFCYYTENNVELNDYCSFGEKTDEDE